MNQSRLLYPGSPPYQNPSPWTMTELLFSHGYLSLFILSFLAATVLPLGSEWLLVALLLETFNPWLLLATATLGNTLGACTTYALGRFGGVYLSVRILRIGPDARDRATRQYRRYGTWSLLFSWLPIIGDPLCLIGGIFKTSFPWFILLVTLGKLARYGCIEVITLGSMG
ncbi:YqaA family protein [Desulfogranum mediterraneum]|uniref:YqaA family protein n=1 Tax=Desulfogranum mediterraneum TaxID=160661 RepID=UPI000411FBAF|nr:YqaA family protein [Desulfogranum mediterraneum]